MEAFLKQSAQAFGFFYSLQSTSEVAARLDVEGDALAALVLTDPELATFARLPTRKRRHEWLSGRMAAKRAFAQARAACDPPLPFEEAVVLNGRRGAPAILGYPNLVVSISHSSDYALAVVAPCDIGVDIERIEPRPLALAHYFCSRDELDLLERECAWPADRDAAIARFWTRKEAVSKFLRLGGRLDFKRINTVGDYVRVNGVSEGMVRLISQTRRGYCVSLAL